MIRNRIRLIYETISSQSMNFIYFGQGWARDGTGQSRNFLSRSRLSHYEMVRTIFAGQNRKRVGGSRKDLIFELNASNTLVIFKKN